MPRNEILGKYEETPMSKKIRERLDELDMIGLKDLLEIKKQDSMRCNKRNDGKKAVASDQE